MPRRGNYRAQVRIGAATFTKIIKVETVKPNRLKIKLDFPDAVAGGDNKAMRGAYEGYMAERHHGPRHEVDRRSAAKTREDHL
ncbi:MAG: hypothetical protein MZV63_12510 [Marinilabiliales bacterium]|nr:hypothetical protein [Marinilabiliales bacterium]